MSEKTSEILLIKNFSGFFNNQNIGHEVINSFCADDGNVYFYIPPYGCIGSEKKDFFKSSAYKNVKTILVFDDTNITNIYKLKQVILNPKKFKSFEDMKQRVNAIKYGGKPLKNINFGDQNFINQNKKDFLTDLKDEDMKVYLVSYILNKDEIYNFDNDNIFIYVKSSNTRNKLKDKSLEIFKNIYGTEPEEINITIGQKQYVYNNLENLQNWFNNKIKKLCVKNKKMKLNTIKTTPPASNYQYDDDNFLSFVRKTNDENYYSNYIFAILNNNSDLLSNFFKYLVTKIYNISDYTPKKPKCLIQKQSMTKDMKIVNRLIKFRMNHTEEKTNLEFKTQINKLKKEYSYSNNEIKSYISNDLSKEQLNRLQFIDGQIDLYLYDENYRIIIENKILSGLNGKHAEISKEINQLDTYNRYLNHLNRECKKENKVIILCPFCLRNNFTNYSVGKGKNKYTVQTITYRDLADFFRIDDNTNLILEKYKDDFIKTINKQAVTKEDLITYRFITTIKQ